MYARRSYYAFGVGYGFAHHLVSAANAVNAFTQLLLVEYGFGHTVFAQILQIGNGVF